MSDAPAAPTLGEGVIGHRMHALHESAVAADEAREFLAATMEPQFPIEAEMARKGLHFILPASWAVEAIQSAFESQSAEIARLKADFETCQQSDYQKHVEIEKLLEQATAANARNARLAEALREAKLFSFHHLHCAQNKLENGPYGLRHMKCDCGWMEASLEIDAVLLDAQPEQGVE